MTNWHTSCSTLACSDKASIGDVYLFKVGDIMIGLMGEIGQFRAIRKYHDDNGTHNCILIPNELTQAGTKRKVEEADHPLQSKNYRQDDEYTMTKHAFEQGKLIVERYDQNGKLIRKTPPGYLPFDQIAY